MSVSGHDIGNLKSDDINTVYDVLKKIETYEEGWAKRLDQDTFQGLLEAANQQIDLQMGKTEVGYVEKELSDQVVRTVVIPMAKAKGSAVQLNQLEKLKQMDETRTNAQILAGLIG